MSTVNMRIPLDHVIRAKKCGLNMSAAARAGIEQALNAVEHEEKQERS